MSLFGYTMCNILKYIWNKDNSLSFETNQWSYSGRFDRKVASHCFLWYTYPIYTLCLPQTRGLYIGEGRERCDDWGETKREERGERKKKEKDQKDGWFSMVLVSAATASWKQRSGGWRAAAVATGPAGAVSAAKLTARTQVSAGRPAFFPRREANRNEMSFLTMSEFLFYFVYICMYV